MRTPMSRRLKLVSWCGWTSGSLTPHGSASGAVFLPGLPGGDEGRAGDGDDTPARLVAPSRSPTTIHASTIVTIG
jgi:hypothetical protein